MPPTLSTIIPVFNENKRIASLLRMLQRQKGCAFEVILCDGGSTDGTVAHARSLAASLDYPLTQIDAPKGRGRQMNAGAKAARGECLLFLHADSVFPDPAALRLGLDVLLSAANPGMTAGVPGQGVPGQGVPGQASKFSS